MLCPAICRASSMSFVIKNCRVIGSGLSVSNPAPVTSLVLLAHPVRNSPAQSNAQSVRRHVAYFHIRSASLLD